MRPARNRVTAWPEKMYLELIFPKNEPVMQIAFYCFGKIANRLPEAMWLTFQPDAPDAEGLDVREERLSDRPARGGPRRKPAHALRYRKASIMDGGTFPSIRLDAPVVALGEKSPIYFSKEQPDLAKGVHFSLFNNAWGTNYIQWFGEDLRFRFEVRT